MERRHYQVYTSVLLVVTAVGILPSRGLARFWFVAAAISARQYAIFRWEQGYCQLARSYALLSLV